MSEGYETYCGLLRLYDGFSAQADGAVPEFEYDHDHPGLRELRTRYRLDSVAGDGDAMARSLRLLHWLHRHVRHSNTDLDLEMNSLSLLEHAFDKGKDSGINCRMLSTTLVEACLSLGLKARTVGLHPLSPYDMDQHVVAVVWTGPAAGWVMLDPMTGSYFKDPDGAILSPWQLRDRFAEEAEISCGGPVDFPNAPEQQAAALYLRVHGEEHLLLAVSRKEHVRRGVLCRTTLDYVRAGGLRREAPGRDPDGMAGEVGASPRLVERCVGALPGATEKPHRPAA